MKPTPRKNANTCNGAKDTIREVVGGDAVNHTHFINYELLKNDSKSFTTGWFMFHHFKDTKTHFKQSFPCEKKKFCQLSRPAFEHHYTLICYNQC